mmetsp:Transcript_10162/g.20990  ORF Transcript_10162/g.20990 Transcript_10162/m.20990 type:complete len:91 (-) Transcript_10162:109-381(-)
MWTFWLTSPESKEVIPAKVSCLDFIGIGLAGIMVRNKTTFAAATGFQPTKVVTGPIGGMSRNDCRGTFSIGHTTMMAANRWERDKCFVRQ